MITSGQSPTNVDNFLLKTLLTFDSPENPPGARR